MKTIIISSLTLVVFLLSCQQSSLQSVQPNNANSPKTSEETKPQATKTTTTDDIESLIGDRATPRAVQECLPKVSVGEPFEFDLSMNPFYLRTDLDGNRIVDYATVIVGKRTKKLGLLICKDSMVPLVFGELAKSKMPLTDMDNDHFIGANWEIMTNKEAREMFSNHPDMDVRKVANAKGEVLVFSYAIDGVLYIYWDGKAYRAVGEG